MLLHGALASSAQLAGLASRVGGQVALPDLDGHGARPEAPYVLDDFVRTALAAAGGSADLVGFSLGGYVALAAAAASPDTVRAVVTIATKLYWTPSVAATEAARCDPARMAERAPSFLADLEDRHPGPGARAVLERTAAFLTGLGTAPALPLEDVRCPVLVVVGDADTMVTREECEDAVRRLPSGRLAVLPGAGHRYERIDPDELAEVVTAFLREPVTPPS